jgi:hypothetical protein
LELWAGVGVQRLENRARKENKNKLLIHLFHSLCNSVAGLKFSNKIKGGQ